MKKLIALLLALTMLLSMAACGAKTEEAPATEAPAAQAPAETAAPTKTLENPLTDWILEDTNTSGTVRFWVPFKGTQGMDDMIAEFNQTYPNIEVVLTTYNNNAEGNVAVNTAMMAGEIDVLHSFELYNAYARWENGMYMDLTDMVAEEGIDLMANWGNDLCTYNDRIYTLPAGGQSYYVVINMNEWEAAGLGEIPTEWTWDEYMEASRAMTHDDVFGGSPYQAINTVTFTRYQVYGKNAFYNEDGTSGADDPMFANALTREINAINEGIWFPLTTYRYDGATTHQAYMTGQVASTVTCNMPRFIRDTATYPSTFKTAFAPWPVEEKGQTNYMEAVSTFSHVGIAENCDKDNYDAIYAFLKWYSTYGCKYLAIAGHMPTWKGTETSSMVDLVFGSEEEAAKLVDVESYKNVVCNFTGNSHVDTILTAYSECNALMQEYIMNVHRGEMTVEEALAELKELSDEAIEAAS